MNMTVTGIVELDKRRNKVFLDGEFAFVLYKGELRDYKITVDAELGMEQYQEIMTELLPRRAKIRAMNLLTARAYTESKLRQKLKEGFYPEQIVEQAIEYVKSYGYVDDRAYAAEYISYHADKLNQQQIEQKLLQRGLSKEMIRQALEEFFAKEGSIDEIAQITKLLERKHDRKENMTVEEQQRIRAMLYRKGFRSDNILKAMDAFT